MNLNPELKIYYQRIYPVDILYQWLSYENQGVNSRFPFREFSFTFENDIYVRYNSFVCQKDFYENLVSKTPIKFDIGAEYDRKPIKLMSHAMRAMQKELVFDIDLTDYDNVRHCCKETDICSECWYFMVVACKILDAGLRDDFGFKHILWVFSGRRGVHCWVCDTESRSLTEDIRKEIVNYFCLISQNGQISNTKQGQLFTKVELPKAIKRAIGIIDKYFREHCVVAQNILGTPSNIQVFFSFIDDNQFCEELKEKFETVVSSIERWDLFLNIYQQYNSSADSLKFLIERIKINYMYPRIDANVTKSMKHLLKAPFCVHPKTNKICIPFNPNEVDDVKINELPTLNSILEEIDEYHRSGKAKDDRVVSNEASNTSLQKSIMLFYQFVLKLKKLEPNQSSEINF